jgi:hypothetical protein
MGKVHSIGHELGEITPWNNSWQPYRMTSFPYYRKLEYKIQPLESSTESNITEDAGLRRILASYFALSRVLKLKLV